MRVAGGKNLPLVLDSRSGLASVEGAMFKAGPSSRVRLGQRSKMRCEGWAIRAGVRRSEPPTNETRLDCASAQKHVDRLLVGVAEHRLAGMFEARSGVLVATEGHAEVPAHNSVYPYKA